MIKLGIECENLEDNKSRWGVGQITLNLLEEYGKNPELQKKFKLYLYFKKRIPEDEIFRNPVFIKRIVGVPSFNIFYHIGLPIRAMMDRLDYMFFPAYMLPPLYLRRSVVMLTNDVYYEYKYGSLPFRYKLAYRLFSNWAAVKATKILSISEAAKKELIKLYGINAGRIFVSRPGVNISASGVNSVTGDYLLYVGQMFPRRHAKETILAFRKIAVEFPGLKLIMVGKDKYPTENNQPIISGLINKINKELGGERIIHHDYLERREEIGSLYSGAKALVYVSDREAYGLPPLESLLFGVPPVIADNDLGHELFGEYAIYTKNSEPDGIAEAMRKALTDTTKREEIKNSGPGFVSKYSWKSFADNFFENVQN